MNSAAKRSLPRGLHRPDLLIVILLLLLFVGQAAAVPVKIVLDNAQQTIQRPRHGTLVLDFTGTLSVGAKFEFDEAILDFAYNQASTTGIETDFGPLDFSEADNGHSVSGTLFTAEITAMTPPGLYAFHFGTNDPARFLVEVENGERQVSAATSFSILVTKPMPVSDSSSSGTLFVFAVASLVLLQLLETLHKGCNSRQ